MIKTGEKLIQSYVLDRYFVSTIRRESSSPLGGPYYETMVWRWNAETREREDGFIIQEDSGVHPKTALGSHASVCLQLTLTQL